MKLRDWLPGAHRELREAKRMLSQPLAARREWVQELTAAAIARDGVALKAMRFGWGSCIHDMQAVRGVGVIQIRGPLVQSTWFQDYSDIRAAVDEFADNAGIHAILLDIDSPGGDVHAEQFELAARIREVRAEKPVYALANEMAASAAYVIAAQASKIYAANANTSIVGSLGVIATHVDWSGYNERQGLTITEVVTGRHKNELSPEQPLSRDGHATLQRLVDGAFVALIESITAGRRALTDEKIRAQQAAIYLGGEAQDVSLIDGIATCDEVIDLLVKRAQTSGIYVPSASATAEEASMETESQPGAAPPPTTPPATEQPAPEAPATEAPAGEQPAPAAGATVVDLDAVRAQVRGESRVEARAIVNLCAVAGIPAFAAELLAEEGMTLESARERVQAKRVAGNSEEINTAVDAGATAAPGLPRIDTTAIYEKLNRRGGN